MIEPPPGQSPKAWIRETALAQRRSLTDRAARSAAIAQRVLPELDHHHQTPLVYVGVRDEVETDSILDHTLHQFGNVVVPYCLPGNELGLFRLEDLGELERGAFGIREPREELRANRLVGPQDISLALIPGVAFDHTGNRIGYGKGYFDRLLMQLPDDCRQIGLAFDCQLFAEIPVETHDIPMHQIITETQTIVCSPAD
ncbi:5-formyltetrahydrofolate cyclo-ligase [Bremerella cremea]|uniref:5-formyltetrahydrofolate cyclo-ligase n=1 Tax=Bremerella cremea TaxID=1031537 RepID=UPI0031F01AB6